MFLVRTPNTAKQLTQGKFNEIKKTTHTRIHTKITKQNTKKWKGQTDIQSQNAK